MRILHVIASADPATGGTIESVIQTGRALARLGHTVEVATADAPGEPWARDFPLPLHPLGPRIGGYAYARRFAPWLAAQAKRYDALVVNGLWQYPGLATRAVAGRMGRRYWVYPHGMLDPWFKRRHPLKHFKKWLYWPWADYRVLRDAAAVLFTTEEERLLARRSFWLYRCREVVVGLGIEPPGGDSARQIRAFHDAFPILQNRRYLLYLGRIHPKKGCDLLVEAFGRCAATANGLDLVVAGPDHNDWSRELRRRADRTGFANRIHWTGMLTGDPKWGAFRGADAFVLPSHQENFGVAVVEALAVGVPVLITNKVNIWREVESDRAGFVADDSPDGVASLLDRWQRLSDDEHVCMRANAANCFTGRFAVGRIAERLVKILGDSAS